MGSALRASVVMFGLIALAADALAPAQQARPPPIPKPGPLAEPRSTRQVGLPLEETLAVIPPDNPQTAEKVALGQKLFFDGRLSVDGTVACATCHDPQRAFTRRAADLHRSAAPIAAIASYERALTSFDSPFDRFIAGDAKAIGEAPPSAGGCSSTTGRAATSATPSPTRRPI
jgi:cytochrome c peroxidase